MRTLTADNPIWWEEIPVEDLGDSNYRLAMTMREDGVGYRGFYIEVSGSETVKNLQTVASDWPWR